MVSVLERLAESRGLPEMITMDNGPELIGHHLDTWAVCRGIKLNFIRPGKPMGNAIAQSFNGRLKRRMSECELVYQSETGPRNYRKLKARL